MKKIIIYIFIIYFAIGFLYQTKAEETNPQKIIQQETQNEESVPMPEENDSIVSDDDDVVDELGSDDENDDTDYSDFLYNDSEDDSNAIYLDDTKNTSQKPTIKKIDKIKDLSIDSNSKTTSGNRNYLFDNLNLYNTKTTSFGTEKTKGNFSFGSTYDNSITPNQLTQTRTLFTKYQKDNFSIKSSYKNNTLGGFDQQFKGSFSFSPEYKINNHLSVQNVYTVNVMDKSSKNEVVFSLKPFNDDRMNLNVGASQINYQDTTPSRSQLNFSTQIKF
ncbi:MAG: hypothetical protein DK841_03160 [Candidatus Melainabacteria bacterium]|nr:MAG: hypothetical protein DK841_03160 [Candidatus Melainabacteria bacterium]